MWIFEANGLLFGGRLVFREGIHDFTLFINGLVSSLGGGDFAAAFSIAVEKIYRHDSENLGVDDVGVFGVDDAVVRPMARSCGTGAVSVDGGHDDGEVAHVCGTHGEAVLANGACGVRIGDGNGVRKAVAELVIVVERHVTCCGCDINSASNGHGATAHALVEFVRKNTDFVKFLRAELIFDGNAVRNDIDGFAAVRQNAVGTDESIAGIRFTEEGEGV